MTVKERDDAIKRQLEEEERKVKLTVVQISTQIVTRIVSQIVSQIVTHCFSIVTRSLA